MTQKANAHRCCIVSCKLRMDMRWRGYWLLCRQSNWSYFLLRHLRMHPHNMSFCGFQTFLHLNCLSSDSESSVQLFPLRCKGLLFEFLFPLRRGGRKCMPSVRQSHQNWLYCLFQIGASTFQTSSLISPKLTRPTFHRAHCVPQEGGRVQGWESVCWGVLPYLKIEKLTNFHLMFLIDMRFISKVL